MQALEKIPVFIRTVKGRTVGVCHAEDKGCDSPRCERDWVTRDRFRQWESTMKRDRYGK